MTRVGPAVRLELKLQLDGSLPPRETAAILQSALDECEGMVESPVPEVRFAGVTWNYGWIAEYELEFWINNYGEREVISEKVLEKMYDTLHEHGILFGGNVELKALQQVAPAVADRRGARS